MSCQNNQICVDRLVAIEVDQSTCCVKRLLINSLPPTEDVNVLIMAKYVAETLV